MRKIQNVEKKLEEYYEKACKLRDEYFILLEKFVAFKDLEFNASFCYIKQSQKIQEFIGRLWAFKVMINNELILYPNITGLYNIEVKKDFEYLNNSVEYFKEFFRSYGIDPEALIKKEMEKEQEPIE